MQNFFAVSFEQHTLKSIRSTVVFFESFQDRGRFSFEHPLCNEDKLERTVSENIRPQFTAKSQYRVEIVGICGPHDGITRQLVRKSTEASGMRAVTLERSRLTEIRSAI
jgi:hypothetical protein